LLSIKHSKNRSEADIAADMIGVTDPDVKKGLGECIDSQKAEKAEKARKEAEERDESEEKEENEEARKQ